MNLIEHYRGRLLEKERALQTDLRALEAEGIVSGKREVRDSTDDATAAQGTSESFEEGTIVSETLEEVQDALRRMEDGKYGKCTLCGCQIEPDRLEAIPWAPLCMEDQKNQGKALSA